MDGQSRPHFARPATGANGLAFDGLPPQQGGASGPVALDLGPRGLWARITQQIDGNAYVAYACDDFDPTAFPLQSSLPFDDERSPCYEVTGRTDVPTDGSVVVFLEPLLATPGYGFTYASSPALTYATVSGGFDITEANAVWENTGLTLSLPSAGTYLLEGVATAFALLSVAAPGAEVGIGVRLYDDTTGQGIPGSESRILSVEGDFGLQIRTGPIRALPYVVDSARVIRLQAYRFISPGRGGTWGTSILSGQESNEFSSSFTYGATHFGYLKIG